MKKFSLIFYYFFLIFYLEIANKLFIFNKVVDRNYFYLIINSLLGAVIFNLISHLLKDKGNKKISMLLTIFIIVYYGFHILFYRLFNMYFSFNTIGLANQAADFSNIVLEVLSKNILIIITLLIPFIILIVLRNKFNYNHYNKINNLYNVLAVVGLYLISILMLIPFNNKMYSAYNLYFKTNALEQSVDRLGILSSTRIDIQRSLFGFNEDIITVSASKEVVEEEKVYEDNTEDIDFNSLIESAKDKETKELLAYLENNIVTKKNEYTGMFKGKNLIFILAEGFNSIAVDEKLTPTLYKLTHNGFVFDNYYSPLFLSTTGGEFQESTALIPTQETLKIWKGQKPSINYALGYQFSNLGYNVSSYHNWTYTYYQRDKTMPTLGYNNYLGCGNGLEKEMSCKWLPSDVDLIEVTYPKYKDNEQFMVNYISVSGHAPYFMNDGNSIAKKNKDLVAGLPYSDPIKAYIATQIEFDKALETLINLLKEDKKLDDTVLVITGDHYPYSLSNDEVNEASSYTRDEIEVNHSNLIIWNNKMKEPIKIEKTASQIDVLPTILNLFDIPYDSRLLVGHDILSTTDGIAIFSDRSWVSDYGTYYAKTGKFVAKDNKEISEDYIKNMNTRVANSFTISNKIIKYNIYNKILGGK
ncbi:MAG: LTA synthase family protein [Bacilli bacterium]|nr:LTA synthase family protein [Bacilli bacterium]